MPDVVMLIVVVDISIEMVLNVQWFTTMGVLVILSASRYATVCFGNDLGFRPLIQATGRFCVSNTYISALF